MCCCPQPVAIGWLPCATAIAKLSPTMPTHRCLTMHARPFTAHRRRCCPSLAKPNTPAVSVGELHCQTTTTTPDPSVGNSVTTHRPVTRSVRCRCHDRKQRVLFYYMALLVGYQRHSELALTTMFAVHPLRIHHTTPCRRRSAPLCARVVAALKHPRLERSARCRRGRCRTYSPALLIQRSCARLMNHAPSPAHSSTVPLRDGLPTRRNHGKPRAEAPSPPATHAAPTVLLTARPRSHGLLPLCQVRAFDILAPRCHPWPDASTDDDVVANDGSQWPPPEFTCFAPSPVFSPGTGRIVSPPPKARFEAHKKRTPAGHNNPAAQDAMPARRGTKRAHADDAPESCRSHFGMITPPHAIETAPKKLLRLSGAHRNNDVHKPTAAREPWACAVDASATAMAAVARKGTAHTSWGSPPPEEFPPIMAPETSNVTGAAASCRLSYTPRTRLAGG